jgi:dTDP-4-amino-4,6-dideoxygalactose transaminase
VTETAVRFADLTLHEDAPGVREAIDRVVQSGWFVLGPEVEAFEAEFAAASGARHAIGVGNGTDALALTLRALGIGAGDEVITSALSAAYTALAVVMAGATPVFADVTPDRLTLDPRAIDNAVTSRTRAVIPVHLYGQAADMDAIARVADRHRLALVEDCCQAHLATANGRPVGTCGLAGAFSFYPTKNLGALGDGGAIVTNDAALAAVMRRLRNGGQASRYAHQDAGVNSRLDELQAAVLRARLPLLRGWTERRRALARRYRSALTEAGHSPVSLLPEVDAGHVYHLFVVRSSRRDAMQRHLIARNVETLVHYPIAVHRQAAFSKLRAVSCPDAERACDAILSLPLYPSLDDSVPEFVVRQIADFKEY